MSKERLEEAGEWLSSMYDLLSLKTDKEDRAYTQKRIDLFNWLIEQAERFEVLSEQHDEALKQNKRYREALEFYADRGEYYARISLDEDKSRYGKVYLDEGQIARKALEE